MGMSRRNPVGRVKPLARKTKPTAKGVVAAKPRRGVNYRKKVNSRKAKGLGLIRRLANAGKAIFLGAVAVCVLGLALWGAYRTYAESSALILKRVVISGHQIVDKDILLNLAAVELGVKLAEIPLDEIRRNLEGHPWIREADVSRGWGGTLKLQVHEEVPVAVVYLKGWQGVTAQGMLLPGLPLERFDLPVVEGKDATALVQAADFLVGVKKSQPGLYGLFSQVRIGKKSEVEIILRDGGARVYLSSLATSPNTLDFLARMMEKHARDLEGGRTLDMRVEGYAYIR